jgi:hypothetical protein
MKHWDKYIGGSIESDLEAFDVSKLDAFEQMQYSDFIKHSTKVEALKILINNVEGDFSQLSPNLNDIAEMYYPEDNYFMDDNYADGGKVFKMAKLSMKPYAFKEKIKFVKENPEILAGKFADGGGVGDDELISAKKKLINILSSLDKKDLFDFIYYIGGVESNYVDRVVSIYEDWINDLPKDELDMLLWRMKQPYFYEFSWQDNFRKGTPVPSKFATHNDFYEKKYKNGGGVITDFNDLNNEGLRKALISFREDFNTFLSNYLQVGKENYILSNIDNVMVIFRDKSLGDFSDVENVSINKWIQPYFDIRKKPLIAEYLNGYKIDGNKIIIDIQDSQMFANGGGVGESKAEKWYYRLKESDRIHFSKKYPHINNETNEDWFQKVWIESGKSIGIKRKQYANGGGVGEFPPKGELTNKDNFLLKYEKKGGEYEFFVYKPITKEVSPQKMNYEQFINYLYAELYLDDTQYANGGGVDEYGSVVGGDSYLSPKEKATMYVWVDDFLKKYSGDDNFSQSLDMYDEFGKKFGKNKQQTDDIIDNGWARARGYYKKAKSIKTQSNKYANGGGVDVSTSAKAKGKGGEYSQYVKNIYSNQSEQSAREGLMNFASEQGFEISDVEKALQVYKYDTEENAWGENYYTKVAVAKMVGMISGKYANGGGVGEVYEFADGGSITKVYNFPDFGVKSFRDLIDEGAFVSKHRTKRNAMEYNRIKFNRMDYAQQAECDKKLNKEKITYDLQLSDGGTYQVSKQVYDYANIPETEEKSYYIKYESGGGVSDLQFTSKTLTKSKEYKLKERLFDGRISEVDLKNIIGFEPNYPTQIVGTIKLEKCFLLPYYKIK